MTNHEEQPRTQHRPGDERRRPISVVVVDEEPLIRRAVIQTVADSGLHVVGEADNGHDAVAIVTELRPDVVLMGMDLPGVSGIEVIGQIGVLAPASRVLVLTRGEHNRVVEAIVAGAMGYILTSAEPDSIVAAVRATSAGQSVLSSRVAGKLLDRIRERDTPVTASSATAAGALRAVLTERELEIFKRLASGESNRQIGQELSLSSNTVSNHVASILAKLQLENRIQAAVHAVRSGIA